VLALVAATPRLMWALTPRVAHGVDVIAAAALTIVTGNLPSSPFFLFFLFALLGAAYRFGLRETLTTAVIAVLVLSAQTALGELELHDLVMRSVYLIIAGFLLGWLADTEQRRRARAAVVSGSLSRLHSETSVHAAMRDTSTTLLALFNAERLLAAVHDPGTGSSYAWTARVIGSRTDVRVREIAAQERPQYFFSAPRDAWEVRRTSRGHYRVNTVGEQHRRMGNPPWPVPSAVWADSNAASLAAVDVSFAGQWSARVFLMRSRLFGAGDLAFFREVTCQVAPAMFSLYLVRRVRARVTAAERARVARELHDGIIQALAGLRFQVAALRRHADRSLPIEAELGRLEHALAEQVIATRELMHRVRPVEVTPRQLPDYLGAIVERFTRETGISAHYHTEVEQVDLSARTCRELARTLQEALVNVRKHSAACNVVVRFSADPIHYRLTIDNDGRPFEFAGRHTLAELEAARRGPLVIKERVREMGGELVIESSAERGVRLDILLRRRLRTGSSKTA
jgi:signal transduction histidine kinase